jgi:hypothetical protein
MNSQVVKFLKNQTEEACRIKGIPYDKKYLARVKAIYNNTPRTERNGFTLFESKRRLTGNNLETK